MFVVKWERNISTSILVEFSGHKIKNPFPDTEYTNDNTESRFLTSMTGNPFVSIFMSCVKNTNNNNSITRSRQ